MVWPPTRYYDSPVIPGGRGGGVGLSIEVVQALPVYQEDIRIYPVFYFRRSDNTYHQAFEEDLAADEDSSMTRNVLVQANITGNANWRGYVANLNTLATPALNDWAFEYRAGHSQLWWYDGTLWRGESDDTAPDIETAFGANYVFLRPDGVFATDAALEGAFDDRTFLEYDPTKQYLYFDVADLDVHRVTAFSPSIPAGTKKTFVQVGAAMFDAATVTTIVDAEIGTEVKAYARTGGGQVPDADIPAGITRDTEVKPYALTGGAQIAPADASDDFMLDSEFTKAAIETLIGLTAAQLNDLVTGGSISGRTVTLNQADGTTITFMVPPDTNTQDGVLASGSIDALGENLTLTLDTGTDITVSIPAVLRTGGGGGITLADIKEFARAGERGVQVGDMDSDTATDNQVPTADGSGGVAWEDQQDPPAPPAGMHLRYFGWKAAGAIVTADLDATLARTNSSMTDTGQYPANNVQATRWFAVPETEGVPTEHYLPPNPLNTIIGFNRQAGTIDDADGEAHIVMVATAQTPITAAATDVRIGHN